ncbi:hypothetical protein [Paraburkholderia hospita]|uniref:hypothetical protein n=1 Tax=Paraburkholderia hospita TaxID=169430 RepID=UPI003ED027D1
MKPTVHNQINIPTSTLFWEGGAVFQIDFANRLSAYGGLLSRPFEESPDTQAGQSNKYNRHDETPIFCWTEPSDSYLTVHLLNS